MKVSRRAPEGILGKGFGGVLLGSGGHRGGEVI